MALISHSQDLMTDEELTLLLYLNTPKNPEFPYDVYACYSPTDLLIN